MSDPSVYECGIKYGQCKRMNQVCDRAFFGVGEDQKEGIIGCAKCHAEYEKCNKVPMTELYTKMKHNRREKLFPRTIDLINFILLVAILLSVLCLFCKQKKKMY
jgi:hypothetical protein